MRVRLYDAHNHLQDERLANVAATALDQSFAEGLSAMVVNGSCEEDWPQVLALAERHPEVIPSFGYHPWYVSERTVQWEEKLAGFLDKVPSVVGEIGLDRWIKNHDDQAQEEVFRRQLRIAADRDLPASIHCLQAWGKLYELLKAEERPACGFVLHSYGGPAEMIPALAKLGAYFSLPGYFAHERKTRQREAFRQVPTERLLIETDAPDQLLPDHLNRHPTTAPDGKPVNHPANISAVYTFASELLERPLPDLAAQVEENFKRLFGKYLREQKPALGGTSG
jgi:TatD DNase family protein